MSLKIEDLIEGEIYYAEYNINRSAIIEARHHSFAGCSGLYNQGGNDQYFYIENGWTCKENIRIATFEEKEWLEACEKADKFIKREEVKSDNYFEVFN